MTDNELQEAYTLLKNCLAVDSVNVNFVKANGEVRALICTTNPDMIPVPKSETLVRESNPDVQVVWDIENKGWRSFRFDRVTAFVPRSMSAAGSDVPNIRVSQLFELRKKEDVV